MNPGTSLSRGFRSGHRFFQRPSTQKPFNEIGKPLEIARLFGGPEGYKQAIRELEQSLYSAA